MIDILCNEKCTKCHHWKQASQKNVDNMSKVIGYINDLEYLEDFVIVGGEPLIYRSEILEIINGIKNPNIRTTIITNGVLANHEFIDALVSKNVHLVFSIDTLDEKEWIFVRGKNTLEIVMTNFYYAQEKLNPIQISVQSVLALETEQSIKKVGEWLSTMGVYHSIQQYISSGFDGEWHSVKESEIDATRNISCIANEINMSIMPNGDVYTCFQQNLIPQCEQSIGNIKHNSAKEILKMPYLESVRNKMKFCNLPCKVLKCNIGDNNE